jgi:predicted dehydrogenase
MADVQLITIDPGHFHAALVQKEMYPRVSPRAHVYGPLGTDLLAHVNRIAGFNSRSTNPTSWELEVHASPDFRERVWRERPGNVVVLAGRNAVKIQYIDQAVDAGLNVLADKPWIILHADMPLLESVLQKAEERGLVAYDIMTERFEITSILQRHLVQDAHIFGQVFAGTADEPGVFMESVHYLKKQVASVPLRRPAAFFDITQQGEGLADVGTHLVDLVFWVLFPDEPIRHREEVQVLAASRWPTVIGREDFQSVTGEADFPTYLAGSISDSRLNYYCNNSVVFAVRGIHAKLNIRWDFEAAPGAGDSHRAVFRGSRACIEIRQGGEEGYQPELYVKANRAEDRPHILAALGRHIQKLQSSYPGVGLEDKAERLRVLIPDRCRVGHEAHFGEVTHQFLRYLQQRETMPPWERSNMVAKYFVTTRGVELGRRR